MAKRKTFKLGSHGRHTISGFEGVIIGKTEWMNGCVRYGIQPTRLHDGKPIEAEWFDSEEIEKVAKKAKPRSTQKTGGPMPDPKF